MTSATAVNLREIAARAWERQQAEVAARQRQEIERARENLIAAARDQLIKALMAGPHDPWGLPHTELSGATYAIDASDDEILNRPHDVDVTISFLGEWFVYRSEQRGPHDLYHVWVCQTCGQTYEPPTQSNRIGSLADLGHWLQHAASLHCCEASS